MDLAPVVGRTVPAEVKVHFDLAEFSAQFNAEAWADVAAGAGEPSAAGRAAELGGGGGGGGGAVPDAGSLEAATRAPAAEVEGALRRTLPKATFKSMEVLGQFNLGFIIARAGDDLFIVDQHAADEKANFERLQASTTLHTQRLIAPLPLQLTAADELVVLDHIHVFRDNGFEIAAVPGAPPTQRLRLLALPFSKHTVFGRSDVHELVTLLAEAPGTPCRLPKLRSMFAMRACRSAVMIGTALDAPKMRALVAQLADLDQPWNCPHGRPTLRHLADLRAFGATAAARAERA